MLQNILQLTNVKLTSVLKSDQSKSNRIVLQSCEAGLFIFTTEEELYLYRIIILLLMRVCLSPLFAAHMTEHDFDYRKMIFQADSTKSA